MNRKSIFLIFISFLLVSCLPEQSARQVASTEGNLDNGDVSDGPAPDANPTSQYVAPYWLDSGSKLTSLTVDYDNNKNHYLFGSEIDSFLSKGDNFSSTYCVYAPFETGSRDSDPLLVRATPATTINYSTGVRTRYLRLNLSSSSGNDYCDGLQAKNSASGSLANLASPTALKTQDVCDTCLNIISSTSISIYQHKGSYLLKVGSTIESDDVELELGALGLRIDMNGNTSGNIGSCTDAGCSAQGFDCCVNGQCVNEGGVKMSAAQADPNAFNLAEMEKYTNPNWYLKYPEFYYICLEDPQNPGEDDPLDPEDPEGDAQEHLASMIADYECVEELKANSIADPFHNDPINESLPADNYTKCDVSNPNSEMHPDQVMKRLYSNCGCSATDLADMIDDCPAYTYKLEYPQDSLGNPTGDVTSVSCVTPPNHDNELPFSDLEVTVNSRSAPHRFFNKNGEEINPREPASLPEETEQEGEPFQYLDNENLFPLNGAFNMNSLLGQMTVSLDKARPAKMIDLEFDKVYYIAGLSGSYTACPSCAKDSWFTSFSPYPTTNQGHGIRATGFTTSRDSWGTNSSYANYEDAVFGRACWVPPTMIPYGHSEKADAKTQRLARLKTQAALYVNGYQRDWFGFNRGALIGSFDGVTWFAIGKGRKVRATSDRLYLAINAPFADLASPTDHVVSVQEYDFITTAAQYDYNPELEINSPMQNDGGLCQQWHECETDSHCISKLGWEYSCVDVYQYRSKWPKFSSVGALEEANDSRVGALVNFLQQGELVPGTSSKKCVYRGAGAPCRVDIENVADEGKRRALACAPNFYCASVNGSDFNKEVARFGADLEATPEPKNHLYGQDANMLGRPKDYVITTGGTPLPTEVKSALNDNFAQMDPTAGANIGLCRPAKALPAAAGTSTLRADQLEQHTQKDSNSRTDFISQISGCNSTLRTSLRYASCPMIGSDGNYVHLGDAYINLENGDPMTVGDSFNNWNFTTRDGITKYYSTQQNMCGLEAIDKDVFSVAGLSEEQQRESSAFKSIEARDLASSDVQIQPTLVQNACLRRAGSVCHTNYDCSPNYKHYEVLDLLHPDVFGNTPEKKFWEEYLVCGQADREPVLAGEPTESQLQAYNEYSMHNNRCCREVGKDLTLYTEDSVGAPESAGLRTDIYGGFQPNNPNRYSRYVASLPQVDDTDLSGRKPQDSTETYASRVSAKRPNDPTWNPGDPSILDINQWKNIHDTAARTCCGGTWVRKFADGTNNWNTNRLNLNVENFKCLNYKSPLLLTDNPGAFFTDDFELGKDRSNLCVDPGLSSAGCAQVSVPGIDSFTSVKAPALDDNSGFMFIDTDPEQMTELWDDNPFTFMQLLSYDSHPDPPYFNWTMSYEDAVEEKQSRQVIFTRIPTFIPVENITDLRIRIEDPGQNLWLTCSRHPVTDFTCEGASIGGWGDACGPHDTVWDVAGSGAPECYYMYDPATRRLKALYDTTTINDDLAHYEGKKNSMEIRFTAPGTLKWEEDYAYDGATRLPAGDDRGIDHRRSSQPGDALHYLEKLAKLEYIGIPQMTYEPIFCNDNYQKLVPGIFKGVNTASEFIDNPNTFYDPDADSYWRVTGSPDAENDPTVYWSGTERKQVADQALMEQEPIFSDNEFKCCLPAGSPINETESANICCSGAAVEVETGDVGNENINENVSVRRCAIPTGTDLNVYFNKFVSGEGLSDEFLGSAEPLDVADFDEKTGEPKTNADVIAKLTAIGETLCEERAVTRGGFYGPFDPEPVGTFEGSDNNAKVNGFVDSVYDNGTINNRNVGYQQFQQGYKWNHHVYCAEGQN